MIWSILCVIVELVFRMISFDTPTCPYDVSMSARVDEFPLIMDAAKDTCEILTKPGSPNIEVVWTFPPHPSSMNQFRVKMSGSQSCKDSSATWFVRYKDGIIECSVDEELIYGSRVCHVTCQQVCRANIGYLHFRFHFLTRLNRSLALCHYALTTNFKAVNPRLRIVWLYLMFLCRCDDGHSAWAALKWSRSKYSICYGIELFSVPRNVKHL